MAGSFRKQDNDPCLAFSLGSRQKATNLSGWFEARTSPGSIAGCGVALLMEGSMTRLMQSLRSRYDDLCSRIAASAERHEAEAARLRAELARQSGEEIRNVRRFTE
jgi:hypothetical protein